MNATPSAWFTAGIAVVALIVAWVVIAAWIVRRITDALRKDDAADEPVRNVNAGGYIPAGTVVDGSGNVRVIREVKS